MANPSPGSDLIFPIEDIDSSPLSPPEPPSPTLSDRVGSWFHGLPSGIEQQNPTAPELPSSPKNTTPTETPTKPSDMADLSSNNNGFEQFNSGNEDIVTKARFNLYGTRQVVASSDKTIKVYDLKDGVWNLIDSWTAHDAEVLEAKWSSPFWSEVIYSIGEDMKFKVWQENAEEPKNSGRRFQCIYSHSAPHHVPYASLDSYGRKHPSHDTFVALVSRTGFLEVYKPVDNEAFNAWQQVAGFYVCTPPPRGEETAFKVVFCPDTSSSFNAVMAGLPRDSISLVVGAMNEAKVYRTDNNKEFFLAATLTGSSDLVRDVSWAPGGSAKGFDLIATASKDGRIRIFKVETPHAHTNYTTMPTTASNAATSNGVRSVPRNTPSMIGAGLAGASRVPGASRLGTGAPGQVGHRVNMVAELGYRVEVWRVVFNRFGTLLASAGDDGNVKLWGLAMDGHWMEYAGVAVDTIKEFGLITPAGEAS